MSGKMRKWIKYIVLSNVLLWVPGAYAEDDEQLLLPRPEALREDIRFWTRVYTEIDSTQGFIHDDEQLSVVYETVQLEANISRPQRRHRIDDLKHHYRTILSKLARGERDNLTAEERRVLALWPQDSDSDTFRRAMSRLRFQLGQSDKFKEGIQRSGRWLPYIRQTLRSVGVPQALAALPHVESSFNPHAYSFVGAAGMWQFTRSTGKRYMRIDHVVDERLDPYLSTEAAARLLKHNYETTDSWPLAITAYNHGLSGMRRAIEKLDTTDVVTVLRKYDGRSFGFASRNFYVAFLAAVEVSRNIEKYFGALSLDSPEVFELHEMPDYIPLNVLIETLGVGVDVVREHNLALRPPVLSGQKFVPKGYRLRLPKDRLQVDAGSRIAAISAGQRFAQQYPDMEYHVRRGDTLSGIADRFGVGLSQLLTLNNLNSRHYIRVGQRLRLPGAERTPASLAVFKADEQGRYEVRAGDTLSLIAKRFDVDAQWLAAANALDNRHIIYPGQYLQVANLETAVPVEASSTVAAGEQVAVAEMTNLVEEKIEQAEPVTEEEAEALAPVQPAGLHPDLSADPSDYTVQTDRRIIVQAAETLGHYADWLEIPTQRLRDLNRLKFGQPVVVGNKVRLDFNKVPPETFEARRVTYHQGLQEAFFNQYKLAGTLQHTLKRGELIWLLSQNKYNVPIWLLRQHNPDLDFKKIRPGDTIVFPVVVLKDVDDEAS